MTHPKFDVAAVDSSGRWTKDWFRWASNLEVKSGTFASVSYVNTQIAAVEAKIPDSAYRAGPGITIFGEPTKYIGLARIEDTATGALLGITVDAHGRVIGTTDATITGTEGEIDVADGDAADGPPTISLADLADSGTGAALVKITRDGKGRVSGTEAATTDDLDEGATNLYFTDERAQDAVGGAVDGAGDVPLSYNDATGAISAALSSGVQASLDLADTAVQPDDFSSALVTLSGNQSIPDSTGTMLSFGTEAYDAGGYFDAGAPTRLTVPADGIYVASASAVFASNAAGYRQLQLFKNGASFVGRPLSLQPAVSGIATGINCDSAPTYCSAGDYFEAQVTQTSGGALNVLQNNATWFAIRRLATT